MSDLQIFSLGLAVFGAAQLASLLILHSTARRLAVEARDDLRDEREARTKLIAAFESSNQAQRSETVQALTYLADRVETLAERVNVPTGP